MPFLLSLIGVLCTQSFIASLVGRVLLTLGFGFVTFVGLSVGIGAAESFIVDNLSAGSAATVNFLSFMQLDRALSMIFSAVAMRLSFDGITSAAGVTKLVAK